MQRKVCSDVKNTANESYRKKSRVFPIVFAEKKNSIVVIPYLVFRIRATFTCSNSDTCGNISSSNICGAYLNSSDEI